MQLMALTRCEPKGRALFWNSENSMRLMALNGREQFWNARKRMRFMSLTGCELFESGGERLRLMALDGCELQVTPTVHPENCLLHFSAHLVTTRTLWETQAPDGSKRV